MSTSFKTFYTNSACICYFNSLIGCNGKSCFCPPPQQVIPLSPSLSVYQSQIVCFKFCYICYIVLLYIICLHSCHESREARQTSSTSPDRREGRPNVHRIQDFIFTKMCVILIVSVFYRFLICFALLKAANVTKDFPVRFPWPQHSLYVAGQEHHGCRLHWPLYIVLLPGLFTSLSAH